LKGLAAPVARRSKSLARMLQALRQFQTLARVDRFSPLAKALSVGRHIAPATVKARAGGCRARVTLGRIRESGLSLVDPPSFHLESAPVALRAAFQWVQGVPTIFAPSPLLVTIAALQSFYHCFGALSS